MEITSESDLAPEITAKSFDLFKVPPQYHENHSKWFRLLRDHDPMHRNADGTVLVTRYEDVRSVWRDTTALVDKTEMFFRKYGEGPLLEHHTTGVLFRDGPDHQRLRNALIPLFSPSSIVRLRPFLISIVDDLLSRIEPGDKVEFVKSFAFRVTISVICKMLGVPVEDGDYIQAHGAKILNSLNPSVTKEQIADGNAAVLFFKEYLANKIKEVKRASNADDSSVMAMLVAAHGRGLLSELELIHLLVNTLNGGHETTTNFISMAMHVMLDFPDQMELFRDCGDNLQQPLEELLRYISPIQFQGRRLTRQIELSSGSLPPNTEVIFGVAAGNRDDRIYADPDRLNLERNESSNLTFGAGMHMCVGRALVKTEASVVLPKVLGRFRKIERAGPHAYLPAVRFRGLSALPLVMN